MSTPEERIAYRDSFWIETLCALIGIPSEFEHEQAITTHIESLLRSMPGVEISRVPHRSSDLKRLPTSVRPFSEVPDRHSLVACLRGTGGGRSLTLNTHLDTAPVGQSAAWSRPPLSGEYDPATGRVHGRGAMDDKAGVVIALAVLDALAHSKGRLAGDLICHFVLEDEITGNGTLLCLEAGHHSDAAFIIDGTRRDRAIIEHAGQLEFTVEVTGRPASVSVSHMGVNAAEVAADLALRLCDHLHGQNDGRPQAWHCFPSPWQCSLQAIQSEGGPFTLPEEASLKFFSTFCPPHSLLTVREKISAFVADYAVRHTLSPSPRVIWSGFAAEPVASTLPDELAALLGAAGVVTGLSTGTSDLRHFAAAGIPCALYGPGGGQNPHRPDEWFPVADLGPMIRFYLDATRTWCGVAKVR